MQVISTIRNWLISVCFKLLMFLLEGSVKICFNVRKHWSTMSWNHDSSLTDYHSNKSTRVNTCGESLQHLNWIVKYNLALRASNVTITIMIVHEVFDLISLTWKLEENKQFVWFMPWGSHIFSETQKKDDHKKSFIAKRLKRHFWNFCSKGTIV